MTPLTGPIVMDAVHYLVGRLGRDFASSELAAHLGAPVADVRKTLQELHKQRLVMPAPNGHGRWRLWEAS